MAGEHAGTVRRKGRRSHRTGEGGRSGEPCPGETQDPRTCKTALCTSELCSTEPLIMTGLGGSLREHMFTNKQLSSPAQVLAPWPPRSWCSAPHPTPSFQRAHLEPTTQGPSQPWGAPGLGQPGALACHGGSKANSVAHGDTHVRTDRSCEPAHVGLLPSSPWPRGSTFSLQFSSRHGLWASRINPASPWLVPVSPSSGVPNPAWAEGHGSGVWGRCRARSCSAPRPAGVSTL